MRDAEVVAGFLRIEEAEMLIELLSSAGVDAWLEGAVGGPLGALIPGAGGGAKLLVRTADAARARELIAASGVFGAAADEGADPAARAAEDGTPDRPSRLQQFPLYPIVVIGLVLAATAAVFLWRL